MSDLKRVVVLLTGAELAQIKAKAGPLPLSKWFRDVALRLGQTVTVTYSGNDEIKLASGTVENLVKEGANEDRATEDAARTPDARLEGRRAGAAGRGAAGPRPARMRSGAGDSGGATARKPCTTCGLVFCKGHKKGGKR